MKEIISLQSVIWNKQIISLNQRKIFLIHITNAPRDCAKETSFKYFFNLKKFSVWINKIFLSFNDIFYLKQQNISLNKIRKINKNICLNQTNISLTVHQY